LAELIDLLQTNERSNGTTFWVSEPAENDFPPLPVIQCENLLAAITNYENEDEYRAEKLEDKIKNLIKKHERLILSKAF